MSEINIPPEVVKAADDASFACDGNMLECMEAAIQAAFAKWVEIGEAQSGFGVTNRAAGRIVATGGLGHSPDMPEEFPVLIIRLAGAPS